MKYVLSLLLLLVSNLNYSQSGIRVYLEKPELLYKQTIIYFHDTCTDGFDQFNDAVLFGGTLNNIWTNIGPTAYVINTFGPLTEDKDIPIGAYINPDTGLFVIGVDETYGESLPYALLDNQVPGYHTTPYVCQGPVSNERFSIHFERPMQIEVVNDCERGYVVIDNDEPSIGYTLTCGNQTYYLPTYTDTIHDLVSGDYTLSLYDSIVEQATFTIQSTSIDATLYLPFSTVYIGDSYITPILNIYTPYNDVFWDFGDGYTLVNDINPVHYYSQPGIYILKAVVNEGNCSRVFESQITVIDSNINSIERISTNVFRPRPTSNFYSIDGKLIKRL